jgi:hypothetical protein
MELEEEIERHASEEFNNKDMQAFNHFIYAAEFLRIYVDNHAIPACKGIFACSSKLHLLLRIL